jgi:ElaB/YqjD/DUF883 family membrane-anchored ribosome-binding protein
MQEKQKRKIQAILNTLRRLTEELEELLEEEPSPSPKKRTEINGEALLKEILALDRQSALEILKKRKQSELGEIFVASGGVSSDKRKPKEWLIEQIIWRVFDFKEGHEAIRNSGQG